MTKDDIIRMAREAGISITTNWMGKPMLTSIGTHGDVGLKGTQELERFAELVAAAEREAIAQMIEDAPPLIDFAKNEQDGCIVCGFTPKLAALTIRARGQQ